MPRTSERVGASLGLPRNLFSAIGFLIGSLFSGARACSASALGSFCDWRAHWSASPKQAEQDSQVLSAACENRWPVRKRLGQNRFKGRRPVRGCPGTCSLLFVSSWVACAQARQLAALRRVVLRARDQLTDKRVTTCPEHLKG